MTVFFVKKMKNINLRSNIYKLAFILTSILLFSKCQKDHMLDCFRSTGKTITQYRYAGSFTKIELKNSINLQLYSDTTSFIQVTAGEHLVDGIITELEGNTLYIRNENRCNWVRTFENEYTVKIGMPNIEHISYFGSGEIRCMDTLRTKEFTFDSWNGSGSIYFLFNCEKTHLNNNAGRTDIHVKGKSGVSFVYIHDTSSLDASEMESGYTYIRNSSTGDCKIFVTKELGAEIKYSGNIYYRGNPYQISLDRSGDGELIKIQ
ncbi:MAG: DUF2807 domain-containing protein [Bacteroidetes bacterium]|nr:MAG: DUF2807 domain-containing protein [Bacteroidota bacterium]